MIRITLLITSLLIQSFLFSQNLVVNGDAETAPIVGNGWTQVSGNWQQRTGGPDPQEGLAYFFAGANAIGELYQEIDVSDNSTNIDLGIQPYRFSCYLRSFDQTPLDESKVIVQYKDDADNVLDTYDTGFSAVTDQWVLFTDMRVAPIGTRIIKITMISDRNSGSNNDGYIDNVVLQDCFNPGTDTRTECDSLVWIDGNTYYADNNTATFNIIGGAVNSCDSLVTLDLTINTADALVTESDNTLTANATGAAYQWLDCNNGFAIISDETDQIFTAMSNGSYAVEVTENGCVDTSACFLITTVGIIENAFGNKLIVYPNPTAGNLTIDLGNSYYTTNIIITDLNGKRILSEKFTESQLLNLKLEEPAGIYILRIEAGEKQSMVRIVKE